MVCLCWLTDVAVRLLAIPTVVWLVTYLGESSKGRKYTGTVRRVVCTVPYGTGTAV